MVSRMYLLNKMTEEDSEIHALPWCQCDSLPRSLHFMIARTRHRRPGEGQPVVVQASRRPGCEQGGRAPGAVGEFPSRFRPRLSPFRPLLRLCVGRCVCVRGVGGCCAFLERRTVVCRGRVGQSRKPAGGDGRVTRGGNAATGSLKGRQRSLSLRIQKGLAWTAQRMCTED
jgi:hypothetical protein